MALTTINDRQKKANQAARQSAKDFGGKVAQTLAYPGQVVHGTFNQLARGVQNLPQTMQDIDKAYGQKIRAANAKKAGGPSPFPTPTNQQVAQNTVKPLPMPEMRNDPMPPVDVLNTNYAQNNGALPQYYDNETVNNLRLDQINNAPAPAAGQKTFGTEQANTEQYNEGPHLPGQGQTSFDNDYMQRNYSRLNDQQANEDRYQRYVQDRLVQDQAAHQVAQNINRGTEKMAESRRLRSGSGPSITRFKGGNVNQLPLPSDLDDFNPKSARGQIEKQKLQQQQAQHDQNYSLAQQKTGQDYALGQQKVETDEQIANQKSLAENAKAEAERRQRQIENQLGLYRLDFDKEKAKKSQAADRAKFLSDPKNQYGMALQYPDYINKFMSLRSQGDKADFTEFDKLAQKFGLPSYQAMIQLDEMYGSNYGV